MNLGTALRNNPLFQLGIRTSLRKERLLPLLSFITVAGVALLSVSPPGSLDARRVLGFLFLLQAAFLFLFGANEVGKLAHQSTSSGMLDFHRISPFPKSLSIFGLVLGAPAAWWLSAAVVGLFAIPYVLDGGFGVVEFLQAQFFLALNALLVHLAMLSISFREVRGHSNRLGIVFVAALVVLPLMVSSMGLERGQGISNAVAHFTCLPVIAIFLGKWPDPTAFFGLVIPAKVMSIIIQGTMIFFLYSVAKRRFSSESTPSLSKPLALGILWFFLMLGLDLGIGRISSEGYGVDEGVTNRVAIALGSIGAFLAGVLVAATAPNALSYYRSLVRAKKTSRYGSVWNDFSLNTGITLFAALAVLVSVATLRVFQGNFQLLNQLQLFGVVSVVILQIGAVRQLIQIKWPSQDLYYSAFFVLIFWGLPILVGALLAYGNTSDLSAFVLSLSAPTLFAGINKGWATSTIFGLSINFALALGMLIEISRKATKLRSQAIESSTNSGK